MNTKQLKIYKAETQLESFFDNCNITDAAGKTILEIGFKSGYFLDHCQQKGMKAIGLEVEEKYYKIAGNHFERIKLRLYDGLKFPIDDASVDYVVSFQVLEHVSSVEDVIKESIRVLKPGGITYHVCPNYKSFYEGHCECIWLPFLNKSLGRKYLRLIGKYTEEYEDLQIIKPKAIKKIARQYHSLIDIVSLGRTEFIKQFNPLQVEKVSQPMLKKILQLMLRFPIIAKIPISIIAWMGCYYPLVIILEKK